MAGGGVKINNITVSGGADGKTPTFKIDDGVLYNSYDGGVTWRELGTVKGEDGEDGAPGAPGAPGAKGDKGDSGDNGVEVYTYHAGEYDDWFTRVPESIPDGGLEQLGDTSYCEKTYDGQRDVRVGDIVILYSPNANSRGQHSVLSIMKEVLGADNCVFTIIAFIEGEQGIDGNFIYNTAGMMDGYTQSGQEGMDYNLQYISASKIDLTGRSRAPRKDDYIIAQNFTTNDSFALFKVDSVLEHLYYFCSRIAFITGAKGVKGDDGLSVVSANITEVQESAGGGLTALVAGETVGSLAFNTAKTADEMTAFFNSLTEWQDMGGVQGVILVLGGSDVPLLMAVNTGTFYALFSSPDANTICVYASEPYADMGITEAGWQNLTDGVLDFSATPWAVSQLSQESLWNGSIAGKSGGATVQSTSREKTYNLSLVMSDDSVVDAGNFVVTDGRSVQSIAVADEGLLITYDDNTTETLTAEFTDAEEVVIDSTPTEGSDNLVTSGGVYAFVTALSGGRSIYMRKYYNNGSLEVGDVISPWADLNAKVGDYYVLPVSIPGDSIYNTVLAEAISTTNLQVIAELSPAPKRDRKVRPFGYISTGDLTVDEVITITSGTLSDLAVGDFVIVQARGENATYNKVLGEIQTLTDSITATVKVIAELSPAQSGGGSGGVTLYWHSIEWYGGPDHVRVLFATTDNTPFTLNTFETYLVNKLDRYIVASGTVSNNTVTGLTREVYGWFIQSTGGSTQPTEYMTAFTDTVSEV